MQWSGSRVNFLIMRVRLFNILFIYNTYIMSVNSLINLIYLKTFVLDILILLKAGDISSLILYTLLISGTDSCILLIIDHIRIFQY